LDGDQIRKGLNSDLGFSKEDRTENIRRIGEVAKLFAHAGFIIIVAFISPFRKDRDRVRNNLEPEQFVEIYLDCPLEECEKRDVKGHYKRAHNGELPDFTGVSSPYEPPLNPELSLKTHLQSSTQCVKKITHYIAQLNRIPPEI
jgi:adenylylsulfate kinase